MIEMSTLFNNQLNTLTSAAGQAQQAEKDAAYKAQLASSQATHLTLLQELAQSQASNAEMNAATHFLSQTRSLLSAQASNEITNTTSSSNGIFNKRPSFTNEVRNVAEATNTDNNTPPTLAS
jgi:hypothetical protein